MFSLTFNIFTKDFIFASKFESFFISFFFPLGFFFHFANLYSYLCWLFWWAFSFCVLCVVRLVAIVFHRMSVIYALFGFAFGLYMFFLLYCTMCTFNEFCYAFFLPSFLAIALQFQFSISIFFWLVLVIIAVLCSHRIHTFVSFSRIHIVPLIK